MPVVCKKYRFYIRLQQELKNNIHHTRHRYRHNNVGNIHQVLKPDHIIYSTSSAVGIILIT